jgi:hypothetical protein
VSGEVQASWGSLRSAAVVSDLLLGVVATRTDEDHRDREALCYPSQPRCDPTHDYQR